MKEIRELSGNWDGVGLRVGIVASRFNESVVNDLVEGSIETLLRLGVQDADIQLVRVPGAFEIPGVAGLLTRSGNYDAVICLGAVIRGETPHFDAVVSAVTQGVARLSLESAVPVIFGVLTTDTVEQAVNRSGLKSGNKGVDAAIAAVEMACLYRVLAGNR